ncbi:hypothetical protein Tco_0603164 [Tanacetum coccineum]
MALPPREQRHRFLRYEGLEYTDSDIADFESRLERIYTREIHRVHVVDFQGMPELLRDGLFARMAMEHRDEAGSWSRGEDVPRNGDIHDYWRDISTDGDFLGPPPSYTLIRDPVLRLCHRMMAHNIVGRSQAPEKYFGLLTVEHLGGLTVIAPELLMIDMAELVRLQICVQLDDTWAWVAMRPERQPDATVGAPVVAEDAPAVDKGDQAVLAPVQAPQQPPPPPPAPARTMPQRMARLEEDVHEIRGALTEQREVIDAMAHDFSRFSTWVTTGLGRMMDRAGVTYTPYSQTHMSYQRRVRQRTGEASSSA